MAAVRYQLSKSNPYYISKDRRLELTHFCLQYNEWNKEWKELDYSIKSSADPDYVEQLAIKANSLKQRMELVKFTADETDRYLAYYIFEYVTNGYKYDYFKTVMDIPIGHNQFSQVIHKFYWLLDKKRD